MKGTQAFRIRIAKDTPSGKPPKSRMRPVIRPMPAPKISMPLGVTGEVTMSVAMKRAGYRIAKRRVCQKKLPVRQRLNKDDTMDFVAKKFGIEILEAA